MKKEESLQIAISAYIKLQYPNVVFTAESSGVRVPIGAAVKMKRQRSRHKQPDMWIAEPRGGYCGLFMELKNKRSDVFKQGGSIRSLEHVEKQQETIKLLNSKGYFALFVFGFDSAKETIDYYMGLDTTHPKVKGSKAEMK